MFNRKNIYIILGLAILCSIFIQGLFLYVLGLSILSIIYINRGLFYTLKANREFVKKNEVKGYEILTKAYNAGVPLVVINGYIYISLKLGNTEIAQEAIEKVLSGDVHFKVKEGGMNMVLTQKALYLWQIGDIDGGITILNNLYENDYRTTIFYGNFGCLLYLAGDYEKAEKICLEAYEYGPQDKVTLDNLTAIYIKQNKWDLAEKFYNELLELNPTFAEAYYHGAQISLNKNEILEAKELVIKCKEFKLDNISSITDKDIKSLEDNLKDK